ncbi:unnamed protein product [Cyclocybe aegerita]|uniref:Uncharacterized protein n=1 Tax=Cyclocybe aegerita TaxID=1973307 RepID=A0A8S0X2E2_CYCAE|nr:unnamed protein product [Cyclocybe aegerita]
MSLSTLKACMHASALSLSFSLFLSLPSSRPPLSCELHAGRGFFVSDYPQKNDEFRLWLRVENASTSTISGDDPEAASSLFKLKSDRNTVISASPEPENMLWKHQTPYPPQQNRPPPSRESAKTMTPSAPPAQKVEQQPMTRDLLRCRPQPTKRPRPHHGPSNIHHPSLTLARREGQHV